MSDEITEAQIRQKIALMNDDEFDQLVRETRPPKLEKGTHVPNLGNRPTAPSPEDHLTALERQGRWDEAMQTKASQLHQLMNEQSRRTWNQ